MPKKNLPWTCLLFCNHCKDLLHSRYSGEFRQCACGKCFIDQTPHYTRHGGTPGEFQLFNIQIDWKRSDDEQIRDNFPYGITAERLRVERTKHADKRTNRSDDNLPRDEEPAPKLPRKRAGKAVQKRKRKANEVRK